MTPKLETHGIRDRNILYVCYVMFEQYRVVPQLKSSSGQAQSKSKPKQLSRNKSSSSIHALEPVNELSITTHAHDFNNVC